uniref:Uncharacterized protein n=1 Tax=uncultured bacterium contig00177 TaxID=1181599 RepID=A0A806JZ74_9BACT|nr:hypothetical protein [uncultured bacterium contig00177]
MLKSQKIIYIIYMSDFKIPLCAMAIIFAMSPVLAENPIISQKIHRRPQRHCLER